MAHEWNMPRPAHTCAADQHSFAPGESFRTYLFAVASGYERRDYCLDCHPPDAEAAIGAWVTRRPVDAGRRPQPIDREALLEFFRRLGDVTDAARIEFRFILALYLWRKKALRYVAGDDGDTWYFANPRSDETFCVLRPQLDDDRVELLSRQLEGLLTGAAEPPEALPLRADLNLNADSETDND